MVTEFRLPEKYAEQNYFYLVKLIPMYMDYVKHVCHHIVKAVKTWPVPGNNSVWA